MGVRQGAGNFRHLRGGKIVQFHPKKSKTFSTIFKLMTFLVIKFDKSEKNVLDFHGNCVFDFCRKFGLPLLANFKN